MRLIALETGAGRPAGRQLAVLALFVTVVTLPFLGKAFHLDDWVYLRGAERLREHGLNAPNGTIGFLGREYPYYAATHPPAYFALLAGLMSMPGGASEKAVQVVAGLCLFVCGGCGYFLGRRFGTEPLTTGLLLALCPAAVISSHSAMTDVPMLALFLLAVTCHVTGSDRRSFALQALAGLFTALALFTSYQAAFLCLLLPAYSRLQGRRGLASIWQALVVGGVLVGWCALSWLLYGLPHVVVAFMGPGTEGRRVLMVLAGKAAANTVALGGTSVFPLFVIWIFGVLPPTRKWLAVSAFGGLVPALAGWGLSRSQWLFYLVFFTAGLSLVLRTVEHLVEGYRSGDRDRIFLAVWALAFTAAVAILLPFGIPRYLLPGVLPFVILFVGDVRRAYPDGFPRAGRVGVGLTLAASLLVAAADRERVAVYRSFIRHSAHQRHVGQVWFSGEGGFRWYAEQAHFQYLMEGDQRPRRGDLILVSQLAGAAPLPCLEQRCRPLRRQEYQGRVPLRTMNLKAHADFYSQNLGVLPYAYSKAPLEEFTVYEVVSDQAS